MGQAGREIVVGGILGGNGGKGAQQGGEGPNGEKALELTGRAGRRAYTLPQCRWVGWDLAFLKDGDVAILEGNWRPGTLAQNTHEKGIF